MQIYMGKSAKYYIFAREMRGFCEFCSQKRVAKKPILLARLGTRLYA